MADNIDVTPGTGKTIATDDVSGVHFPKTKIDVGGDGSSVPLTHTEPTIPVSTYIGEVTHSRVGAYTPTAWDIAIPAGTQSIDYTGWQSVGSGLGTNNSYIQLSYDSGTTYTGVIPMQYWHSGNGLTWGNSFGGSGLPMRAKVYCENATHIRIYYNETFGSGNTLSERVRFSGLPARMAIESAGLLVAGTRDGLSSDSRWLAVGANKLSSESYSANDESWGNGFFTDRSRRLVVLPYHLPDLSLQAATAAETGTSNRQILAAQGSGYRIFITTITWSNDSAVQTEVEVKDGSSTVIYTFMAKANDGGTITFPVPLKGTANTALNFAPLTTAAAVKVSAVGYKSQSG